MAPVGGWANWVKSKMRIRRLLRYAVIPSARQNTGNVPGTITRSQNDNTPAISVA